MRFGLAIVGTIAAASAFPTVENLASLTPRDESLSLLTERSIDELSEQLVRLKEKRLLFDPLTKPVDVSGKHSFRAPDFKNGDQRGPCPGLNALANHGYIPHDGVVSLLEVIEKANTVFGMSLDLVALLAGVATVYNGNPLSLNPGFSIGGVSPKSNNILGNLFGLLGKPRGLDGSHNTIESDSSATRNDLYNTGNAHTMNLTLFQKMLESAEGGFITMDDLADRAAERFYESIATNPAFYYGPYTGTIARNAGYAFMGRFISNHTKEHPQGGHLSKEVVSSFFGVYEENGKQVYREGHERIPENWYRIAVDYSLTDYNLDLVAWVIKHPVLLSVGGNQGEVNTFTGVDIADLTGGVLNATTLLEGNNLVCFALNVLKTWTPTGLSTVVQSIAGPLKLVDDILLHPLLDLSCPAFADLTLGGEDLWSALLDRYPGAKQSGMAF
ncbi:heme-thiolate peroxidase [Xylaria hypoxylon]|uniref:Heme-thiolate peroxidase n=1 Tax=Xylaria hypoxylon TaxID=37992 RepID=A0A4Z0Y9R4_9PEZI|nr:heme-thiolate peroxidase [Xylaria hypoxylon]